VHADFFLPSSVQEKATPAVGDEKVNVALDEFVGLVTFAFRLGLSSRGLGFATAAVATVLTATVVTAVAANARNAQRRMLVISHPSFVGSKHAREGARDEP
jgi:hypothetical protein